MGVKSLWSLLEPVGRPIPLENMEGKALAIDSSIWIYQFQATMRDKDGRALVNAHVLGFLRRICKLLFHGIRPVFVFDGGAPALKRNTITDRKKKKSGAAASHAQIAERLLAAQMRREALVHASAALPPTSSKGKQRATSAPVVLDEGAVYLEDIDSSMTRTPAKAKKVEQHSPVSSTKKTSRFYDHDPYRLPEINLDEQVAKATRGHAPDFRLATEEELRAFVEEMRPEDLDITSPAFRELPTEVQYEIVGDLRLKSRQTSYKRLQNMLRKAETPLDFSKEQIKGLQAAIGKAHINIPVRIASERDKEYLLVKNESAEGGWILGLRDEGTRNFLARRVTTDMDMEEVTIPQPVSNDRQRGDAPDNRSSQVARLSRSVERGTARRLFDLDEDEDVLSEQLSDEDPELAMAIQASLDTRQSPLLRSRPHVTPLEPQIARTTPPSRLETSLVIAGAGPSRRRSGTYLEHAQSVPTFGRPSLLVSPRTTHRRLDLEISASTGSATSIQEEQLLTSPSTEELSHTLPTVQTNHALIAVDSEPPAIDDDMNEIVFRKDSNTPVTADVLPTDAIISKDAREREVHVSAQPNSFLPGQTTTSEVTTVEDDNDSIIEWSRSPSPAGAGVLPTLHPEATMVEDWDAAQEMDPQAEEGEFARFVSQVKGRDIEVVRHEIDEEIRILNQQRKAALRDSDDITQQMISQIMLMLRLFGIPYITAPMEAEAQCAELVRLGLVEGIITDDSDVFLFGGLRVYKNMFNQSKTVECFLLSDLSREFGLTRLPGVGPVVAMELMQEFPGDDGLHKFKDWWSKVQSGRDRAEDNQTGFKKRFKKKFKDLYLQQDWPNPLVRDAYYHPTVDSSEEPFKWGIPDLDALRHFIKEELGWDQSKVDDLLMPIIQKMSRRNQVTSVNKQGDLNEFFNVTSGAGTVAPRKRQAYSSKRLQQVVTKFRKEQAKNRDRSTTPERDDRDCNAGPATEDIRLKKKRKTAVSRKGKYTEAGQTENVTRTATIKGKKNGGARTADAAKSRKRRHSNSDENSDDRPDGGERPAGAQEVHIDSAPSAPLAVQLRPRVKPRVRKAPEQLP
ncbi:PIN domain-like protein [Pisolithus sp. B1]|nr:PIN domain-like protein [Pisolithus sp. B1]